MKTRVAVGEGDAAGERVGFRQSEAAGGYVRFDRRITRSSEDLAKLARRDQRELQTGRALLDHP